MKARSNRLRALIVVLALCCLSACGQPIVRPLQSQNPSSSAPDAVTSPTQGAVTSSAPDAVTSPTQDGAYPLELDGAALAEFDNALRLQENYGFLLSSYSDVRDVALSELFYSGAGIEPVKEAYDIRTAYECSVPYEDWFDSDCDVLTVGQLDDFLQTKTGYSYADMRQPLTWLYFDSYDAYLHYHGDTNYIRVTCAAGRQLDADIYELDYAFDGGVYDEDGTLHEEGTVTVRVSVVSLVFLENTLR